MAEYQGVELPEEEVAVLEELEWDLGEPILKVDNLLPGFHTAGGHVTKLNLYEEGVISLPENIDQLTALTHLTLSFNQLTYLPDSIGQLTALTHLNLDNNYLTSLLRRRSLVENSRESGPPIQWARGSHADLRPKGAGSEACVAM